ncbi:MAG: UDP-2,3-diacylglucosamine diphosphatase LpxI [Litorimonas sp.]
MSNHKMQLGLIAGGGALPKYVEVAAREMGAPITIAALHPFANKEDYTAAKALHIGQLGKAFKMFKAARCTHVCMAGLVSRPDFSQIKPDLKAMTKLPSIIRAAGQGDDALLRHMMGLFEDEGFKIISPQELCSDLLLTEGVIGEIEFQAEHRDDALKACEIAREIGKLDIGQAAIVSRGVTLAVEAQEGTDAMLERVELLAEHMRGVPNKRCGVLAKLIKPSQDRRVDLPVIGPETIRRAARAGLAGIVAVAGEAFVLDREEVIELADEAGLFIVGIPAQSNDASINSQT